VSRSALFADKGGPPFFLARRSVEFSAVRTGHQRNRFSAVYPGATAAARRRLFEALGFLSTLLLVWALSPAAAVKGKFSIGLSGWASFPVVSILLVERQRLLTFSNLIPPAEPSFLPSFQGRLSLIRDVGPFLEAFLPL